MFNKSLILKTAMFLICVLLAGGGLGMASDAGPENMELKSYAGKKTARFPHRKHQENFACKECHKQNSESAPTKCSGCHIK